VEEQLSQMFSEQTTAYAPRWWTERLLALGDNMKAVVGEK